MSDLEAKYFVRAFTRFLHAQIADSRFSEDIVESLEVATQCLETAYGLEADAAAAADVPAGSGSTTATDGDGDNSSSGGTIAAAGDSHPLAQIDLFELFLAHGGEVPVERKAEADAVKNEGNRLMKEEKFNEAIKAYTR